MEINFPTREYGAYIFDCDGTLIDSMPVHYRAWVATLEEHGVNGVLSEDDFYSLGGVPTDRLVEILNEKHGLELDPAALGDAKEETYLRLLPHVEPIEPVVKFARDLAAAGRRLAVASGGGRVIVDRALYESGLTEIFPVVVTPEDVAHGKPAPDLFLRAAELLDVEPTDCLVLEDAVLGKQAAIAAGMDYLIIPCARERRTKEERRITA